MPLQAKKLCGLLRYVRVNYAAPETFEELRKALGQARHYLGAVGKGAASDKSAGPWHWVPHDSRRMQSRKVADVVGRRSQLRHVSGTQLLDRLPTPYDGGHWGHVDLLARLGMNLASFAPYISFGQKQQRGEPWPHLRSEHL